MDWNRFLFIQIQILSPDMHYKWKEMIDNVCKQPMKNRRDQLPTESRIEIEDNSNALKVQLHMCN